ncbi:MAG: hypothetical protein LUE16_00695 [Lachnospiraceae bacterium]|nr:hypothetical protein [Lachnospiraceae bacterium]
MKYDQQDIIRIIDLAFKGCQADSALQSELRITSAEDIERLHALLKEPDTLSALEILFNGIYPQPPQGNISSSPLLQAADKYPLEYLCLSARTMGALTKLTAYGELRTVADLLKLSDGQLTRIRGIGANSKSMEEIRSKRMKFIQDYNDGLIR